MHVAFGVGMALAAAAITMAPVTVEAPREPTIAAPAVAQETVVIAVAAAEETTESVEATVAPDPEFDSFAEYLDWMVGH